MHEIVRDMFQQKLQREAPMDMFWLAARLKRSGIIGDWGSTDGALFRSSLIKLYLERVERLDVERAKQDMMPFVSQRYKEDVLPLWSKELFSSLAERIKFE